MARPKIRSDEYLKDYQRQWYLANREKCIARATARKRRIAAEKRAARESLNRAGIKACAKCRGKKLKAAFWVSPSRRDGLYPYCKPCARGYLSAWNRRHGLTGAERLESQRAPKRDFVTKAKAGPCADCGGSWPAPVMHFHHRHSAQKTAGLAVMVSGSFTLAEIKAEIAKCDLVCANCHALRHMHEREAA